MMKITRTLLLCTCFLFCSCDTFLQVMQGIGEVGNAMQGNGGYTTEGRGQNYVQQQASQPRTNTSNRKTCAICHGNGRCSHCAGRGSCTKCAGRGTIKSNRGNWINCPRCNGSGSCKFCKGGGQCHVCHGKGTVKSN